MAKLMVDGIALLVIFAIGLILAVIGLGYLVSEIYEAIREAVKRRKK